MAEVAKRTEKEGVLEKGVVITVAGKKKVVVGDEVCNVSDFMPMFTVANREEGNIIVHTMYTILNNPEGGRDLHVVAEDPVTEGWRYDEYNKQLTEAGL